MAALRVPPPSAASITEQWIIDGILHIDECLDEHKRDATNNFKRLNDSQQELRAEVSAWLSTANASDSTLLERIKSHEREHQQIDALHKERRSLVKMQLGWLSDAFRLATSGGVIVVVGAALKFLGVI